VVVIASTSSCSSPNRSNTGGMERDPMIEIAGLTKTYRMGDGEVNTLRGVSFSAENGAMIAIRGPSGSGKSTPMNVLACLDKPTSGSYKLDGTEVSTMNDNWLAQARNRPIGFVWNPIWAT